MDRDALGDTVRREPTEPITLGVRIGKNRYGPVVTDPITLWWWPWFCRIEDRACVPVEGVA